MKSLFAALILVLPVTTFAEGRVYDPIFECSGSIPLVKQGYSAEYQVKIGDQRVDGPIRVEINRTVTGPDMGRMPVLYYGSYGQMIGDINTGIVQIKFDLKFGSLIITKENAGSFSGLLLLNNQPSAEAKVSLDCTKN